MDELLEQLRNSLQDQYLSKTERKTLLTTLKKQPLDQDQLAVIRMKMYEWAERFATPENYRFVLEWTKEVTSILEMPQPQPSGTFVYFSPGESCLQAIQNQIRESKKQLLICVFTISDDRIANEIVAAHERGLPIRVITDNDKSLDEGSDIARLSQAGVQVRMDTSPNHMHHKFMVTDQQAVITGSYNWTRSAARFNHENVLPNREPSVVELFTQQFELLWKTMADY